MQLMETRFAARLRLGEDVIGELEAAVATAPYREELWELLITALYRGGRQADALAAYQRVRDRLDGRTRPGARAATQGDRAADPDPGSSRSRVAGGQPAVAAAELVARDGEIAALRALLVRHRLVEVVGPGGIGKTAVAIATGRTLVEVPVWLVRLEAAQTADDVLDTVVAALGVVGGEAALRERLRRTEAVLILDNCEHVVDAAAALVERLLDAAPTLRVLCTSQVPLELAEEAVFELAPLTLETLSSSSPSGRPGRATRSRCASCAGRSTACRSRSSSRRRARGRCPSRRSRADSTTASPC